jgi:hypothetical protein
MARGSLGKGHGNSSFLLSCLPYGFLFRKPDQHGQEIGTGLARANRHAVLAVHNRYTKVLKKRIA